jgi:hypothetical protein
LQEAQGAGGLVGPLGEDSSGLRCSFKSHGRKNWGGGQRFFYRENILNKIRKYDLMNLSGRGHYPCLGKKKKISKRLSTSMEKIVMFRSELKKLGAVTLLQMAFSQKEKRCVLRGLCPFYLNYKGCGFCVSEILGEGCQDEKLTESCPDEEIQGENQCPDNLLQLSIGL